MSRLAVVALFLIASSISSAVHAQDVVDGFAAKNFAAINGAKVQYRLFVPDAKARTQALPVIIYLHGSGGIGSDNLKQISGGNTNGTHVWIAPPMQARHAAFVVAPQLPPGQRWDRIDGDQVAPYAALVIELLDALSKEFSIDRTRVYLTGQSLGGIGTWDLIAKRPEIFAAAVPLCGAGDPARVSAARHVAIWAFHGAKDDVVPVAGSRDMVAALRASGGSVKYTEYPDVEHDVWLRAYVEPALADWLFAQKRSASAKRP